MKYKQITDVKNIKPDIKYKICQAGNPMELGTFIFEVNINDLYLFGNINPSFSNGVSIMKDDFENYDVYETMKKEKI